MSRKTTPQGVSHSRPIEHAAPFQVDSRELLGTNREIAIRHQDEIYRLRRTRQGKLILTK